MRRKPIPERENERGSKARKTPDPYLCLLLTALFLVLYSLYWGGGGEWMGIQP